MTTLSLLLCTKAISARAQQIRIVCGTPVNQYYIYEINGERYSSGKKAVPLLFSPRVLAQGKHYYRSYSRFNRLFRRFFNTGLREEGKRKGVQLKPYSDPTQPVDTLVFTGIILKYPLERPGNPAGRINHTILIDSFRRVNACPGLGGNISNSLYGLMAYDLTPR